MNILIKVEGIVQGVSFRYHTQAEARRLGLCGYVRNLPDMSVEALICGDRAAELVAWCHNGPPLARVSRVIQGPVADEVVAPWLARGEFVILR